MRNGPRSADFVGLSAHDGTFLWVYNLPKQLHGKRLRKPWDYVADPHKFNTAWRNCLNGSSQQLVVQALGQVWKCVLDPLPESITGARVVIIARAIPKEFSVLTDREREVLHHLALGGTTRRIAGLMDISTATVEKHRQNIRRKTKMAMQELLCMAIHARI